VKTFKN